MRGLVVGATGATGRLLVKALLDRGSTVRTIVRSRARLLEAVGEHTRLEVNEASLLDLSDEALADQVDGCDAIASCLGHNLTFRGVFGPPRRLVTDATRRLCEAASTRDRPIRFVLMGSASVRDGRLNEPTSVGQRAVIGLIRTLVPPHADNEAAAEWLRSTIGPNDPSVEWAIVRPDSLVDAPAASDYTIRPSPARSAIFDPGRTSRANVAHFMARLITEDAVWSEWRGRMPIIYDREP